MQKLNALPYFLKTLGSKGWGDMAPCALSDITITVSLDFSVENTNKNNLSFV